MIVVPTSAIERFLSKARLLPNGCWVLPNAATDRDGYAIFRVVGSNDNRAHRVAYAIFHDGDIETKVVRHTCDNAKCCSPFHLKIGTHVSNVQDRVNRGRSAGGKKHSKGK